MSGRAIALRAAFDAAFAHPATPEPAAGVDLIGLRLGAADYAIRMSEVAGLRMGLYVTAVPTPMPELMGVAGIGGVLVPVYDLAASLGLPAAAGRWTVLVEGGTLALAFTVFTGHFRVDPAAIAERGRIPGDAVHIHQFAIHAGRSWPVIDIPSVVLAIRKRMPPAPSTE